MKLNKIAVGAVALLAASLATSCSEGQYWDAPANNAATVSFPKPAATIGILADQTFDGYDLMLTRANTGAAATVDLTVTNPNPEVITAPSTADFAAGKSETSVKITVNTSAMAIGKTYSVTITAPGEVPDSVGPGESISPAANHKFTFKISKNYTWKAIGWMAYTDGFVSTFYGVEDATYMVPVEVPEQAEGNGIYRLVNPYGEYYPYNEPGDFSGTSYLEINARNPAQVYIPTPQEQGMNWGEGNFIMGSIAGLRLNQGWSDERIAEAGLWGTLANGKITFPAGTLIVGMAKYNDGGLYGSNKNGSFCLDVASLTTVNPFE